MVIFFIFHFSLRLLLLILPFILTPFSSFNFSHRSCCCCCYQPNVFALMAMRIVRVRLMFCRPLPLSFWCGFNVINCSFASDALLYYGIVALFPPCAPFLSILPPHSFFTSFRSSSSLISPGLFLASFFLFKRRATRDKIVMNDWQSNEFHVRYTYYQHLPLFLPLHSFHFVVLPVHLTCHTFSPTKRNLLK